jgi:Arc/MetJ-type ribon-helix-helix transcriptional regulator
MTTTDDPDDDTRSVEIPERTAAAVAERLPATEFDSIDEYVATALDRLLRELGRGDHDHTGERSDERERDEAVTDRLESLGYL